MVLTHEREHARRRDPLTQWLALLNRAIFWFHPLAWWLERKLAMLAEEACDAAVLAAGHSPHDYSEYLLDMARTVSRQRGRVRLVGMAMPGNGLGERLRLILKGLPTVRVSRARLISTAVFCVASSALFAAGTLAPRSRNTTAQSEKFDVVSIKPCPDVSTAQTGRGAGPNLAQTSPGHVYWACVTLASLVDQAYAGGDFPLLNVQERPIVFEGFRGEDWVEAAKKRVRGAPPWMFTERFTIEATASVDTISPQRGNLLRLPPAMNRALRAMLEDRFRLKLRRATEQVPLYALAVGPDGLKIKAPAPGECVEATPAMPRFPPSGSTPYCGTINHTTSLERLTRMLDGEDTGDGQRRARTRIAGSKPRKSRFKPSRRVLPT